MQQIWDLEDEPTPMASLHKVHEELTKYEGQSTKQFPSQLYV